MTRALRLLVVLMVVGIVQSCSFGARQDGNFIPVVASPNSIEVSTPNPLITAEDFNVVPSATLFATVLPVMGIDVSSLPPDFWMAMPVVPEGVSDRVREIYERGLLMGNDPNAFSKVGDCHSTNPFFWQIMILDRVFITSVNMQTCK